MTIAISAICDAHHDTQTGNILLAADTLISYDVFSSNTNGTKLYSLPHGFFMTVGDSCSCCHQFNGYLYEGMESITFGSGFIEKVRLAISRAIELSMVWARSEIIANYGVTHEEYLHDRQMANREEIRYAIEEALLAIDVIVCGFSPRKEPIIVQITGSIVRECMNPGFACAGSGAPIALDWLNFRKQHNTLSTQRTYYHLMEALAHSKRSSPVGGSCHILLLKPEEPYKNVGLHSPLMQEWFDCFYPKPTELLDSAEQGQKFAEAFGIGNLAPKLSNAQK
jgi:hypothetical protein